MRNNRYSWWTHWREIADYFLPRRYRWLITPNMQNRGSPINQHIIDSTGCLANRNLASGIMSGKISPTQPWFGMRYGNFDSTQTTPISLWLSEVERIMRLIFSESNFYTTVAQWLYDLTTFGTAVLLIYEDFENVINCRNACAGEYYVDIDGRYRPTVLGLEFTMTIRAVVDEFGYENCSESTRATFDLPNGAGLTREIIIAQVIEPNDDGRDFGIGPEWAFRECFWEWGGSTSPQNNSGNYGFLRKKGYHEQPNITCRWDLVSNDPYGRSPAMDALGDQKQLQLESKRKAQAIDKMVNPPLVADIQLKNKPASLLPGGITFVSNFAANGRPGIASVYDTKFPVAEITEDLNEIRERLKYTFYNHLFQPISQFETRSNITAVEIQQRKAESLIMLGPVFERLDNEGLRPIVERVFAIASRAGIFPPAPPEMQGKELTVQFVSMLKLAQDATNSAGIQQVLAMVGNLAGIDPQIADVVDFDFAIEDYSSLLNNDPRMIRTTDAIMKLRQDRAQQQQAAQQADQAQKLAMGAKTLSQADMGGGTNALQALTGGGGAG
jgi:hypothetical protein